MLKRALFAAHAKACARQGGRARGERRWIRCVHWGKV